MHSVFAIFSGKCGKSRGAKAKGTKGRASFVVCKLFAAEEQPHCCGSFRVAYGGLYDSHSTWLWPLKEHVAVRYFLGKVERQGRSRYQTTSLLS